MMSSQPVWASDLVISYFVCWLMNARGNACGLLLAQSIPVLLTEQVEATTLPPHSPDSDKLMDVKVLYSYIETIDITE